MLLTGDVGEAHLQILLYIAMFMSAVSGVMVLMPIVYIHRIVNNLILNGMVDFDYVKENSIYAAVFAGLAVDRKSVV